MSSSDTLILSMAKMWKGPDWFYVTSMQTDKVVYYSFSRKKVNRFIKIIMQEKGCLVSYDDSVFCKSLDYNFRYSPKDYFIGALLFPVIGYLNTLDGFSRNSGGQSSSTFLFATLVFSMLLLCYSFLSKRACKKVFK